MQALVAVLKESQIEQLPRLPADHAELDLAVAGEAGFQFALLHLMAPYFLNISVVFSIGSASTVCPRPVVVARNRELYTASSVASITARNSGDIASFDSNSTCRSGRPYIRNEGHRHAVMTRQISLGELVRRDCRAYSTAKI